MNAQTFSNRIFFVLKFMSELIGFDIERTFCIINRRQLRGCSHAKRKASMYNEIYPRERTTSKRLLCHLMTLIIVSTMFETYLVRIDLFILFSPSLQLEHPFSSSTIRNQSSWQERQDFSAKVRIWNTFWHYN